MPATPRSCRVFTAPLLERPTHCCPKSHQDHIPCQTKQARIQEHGRAHAKTNTHDNTPYVVVVVVFNGGQPTGMAQNMATMAPRRKCATQASRKQLCSERVGCRTRSTRCLKKADLRRRTMRRKSRLESRCPNRTHTNPGRSHPNVGGRRRRKMGNTRGVRSGGYQAPSIAYADNESPYNQKTTCVRASAATSDHPHEICSRGL